MKKNDVKEYLINEYVKVLNENGASMAGPLDNNENYYDDDDYEDRILDRLSLTGTYYVIYRWQFENRGFQSGLVDPRDLDFYADLLGDGDYDLIKTFLVVRNPESGEYMISDVNFKK